MNDPCSETLHQTATVLEEALVSCQRGCARLAEDEGEMTLEGPTLASLRAYDPTDQGLLSPGRSVAIHRALLKAVPMSETKSGVLAQVLRAEDAKMEPGVQENYWGWLL